MDYSYTKHLIPTQRLLGYNLSDKIFIPSYGWNKNHYYHYIDFGDSSYKHWKVSYKKDYQNMQNHLKDNADYSPNDDLLDHINFSFVPHSSIINDNNIYVFSVNAVYFTVINTKLNTVRQIYEEQHKMISSTNVIFGDFLFYGRYSAEDRLRNIVHKTPIPSEIVCLNLKTMQTEVICSFESCNIIHSVSINPGGRYIIAVSTTADPNIPFTKGKKSYSEDELEQMLDAGLNDSQIHIFDRETNTYQVILMDDSPAHIEFGKDPDICYISSHSLGVNPYNGFVYCFGKGAINRLSLSQSSEITSKYQGEDFSRLSTHKVFQRNDKEFIAVTVYPQQIFILDAGTMQIVTKIQLGDSIVPATLNHGAYRYPRVDKTPFSVHPINESPYLFLITGKKIQVYNFDKMKEEVIYQYNILKDPIAVLGHSCKNNF